MYGGADFLGGIASRRTPASTVVVLSQIAGLALLACTLFFMPSHLYIEDAPLALVGGLCGAVGIAALYAALAISRMGIVSPVTAVVAAGVPVLFGLATGERPSVLALCGVGLALVAVVLVSTSPPNGTEGSGFSVRDRGVQLAVISGIAIGFLYVVLAHGHRDGGLAFLAMTRCSSIPLLFAYALLRRESLRPAPGSFRTLVAAGVLDMGANVLFVLATRQAMLVVVAVITSFYPASTVLCARIFLHERLSRIQWAGVGCAIGGVVMISAG